MAVEGSNASAVAKSQMATEPPMNTCDVPKSLPFSNGLTSS
jgi:hypothetical protein